MRRAVRRMALLGGESSGKTRLQDQAARPGCKTKLQQCLYDPVGGGLPERLRQVLKVLPPAT